MWFRPVEHVFDHGFELFHLLALDHVTVGGKGSHVFPERGQAAHRITGKSWDAWEMGDVYEEVKTFGVFQQHIA